MNDQYKIQTESIPAIVSFLDGHKEEVWLFKPESDFHDETPIQSFVRWLNGRAAFLAARRPKSENTIVINKTRICWIELDASVTLAEQDRLGKAVEVTVVFPRGSEIKGRLVNDLPEGRQRTLDFLNVPERFFFLEAERVYLINRAAVSRVYD